MKTILRVSLIVCLVWSAGAGAAGETSSTDYKGLDQDVQSLNKDVLEISKDLFVLEEDLLFPATTQVSVFLSLDVGQFFDLDSVQLKIGGKEVASYLYTRREVDALRRGGVQRLYVGNLPVGDHELVAIFTGKGPHDRDYRRGATKVFTKGIGPKYIELRISDLENKQQPEFAINEWE
jgi:hypothetical protein